MVSKKVLGAAGLAFLVSMTACRKMVSQDPADSFANGKFPRQLEWIRGQIREFTQSERDALVARAEQDARRDDLLRVAVIDSGVDIAHKDLQSQLEYRVVNGRLAGAGMDIMGNAASGTHVYVDPTLFAFGAEDVRKGLIFNPPESPLRLLKASNDAFSSALYDGIQADPVLRATLFGRIPKESLSVASRLRDLANQFDAKLKEYEINKQSNDFLKPAEMREAGLGDMFITVDRHDIALYDYVTRLEHGDRFLRVVRDAYVAMDAKTGYERNLKNLDAFLKARDPDTLPHEKIRVLREALNFVIWGVDAYDPFLRIEWMLKSDAKFKGKTLAEAADAVIRESLERYDEMEKSDLPKSQKEALQEARREIVQLRNAARALENLKDDPVRYAKMRSDLRRYVIRTQHPYLLPESNSNSHATHVSGVIARQDPNIRIVPIRVTTSSVSLSEAKRNGMIEKYLTEFAEWSRLPLIQELKKVVAEEYQGLQVSDRKIAGLLRKYLEAESLNMVFVDDVVRAVETAGRERLKLANVSLGTTFKKDHTLSNKSESYVVDLFAEFARYRIGQAIHEKAPGTLFMVATGNDGGWVDGVSKTAFPVGITSTRLLKIAAERGLPEAPNNMAKNVLAIGSVGAKGTLTPFTNILIDPKIRQIFSTGEEIQSSVPAKNIEKAENFVADRMTNMDLAQSMILNAALSEPDPERSRILNRDSDAYSTLIDNMKSATSLVAHVESPPDRERMSGTSMATPTATGVIGKYILERMKMEKISAKDAYLHPSLMPEKVMGEVMALARTSSHSSVVTIKMLVDGIETWTRSPKEVQMEIGAKKLLGRRGTVIRCEAVF